MGRCEFCLKESEKISKFLGVCKECILNKEEAILKILKLHKTSRVIFNLKDFIPKSKDGTLCKLCAHSCRIGEGEEGFCSIRKKEEVGKTSEFGKFSFYYDPIPTNCVSSWVCKGNVGNGYNLAVFFHSCSFNCLYCQNWHWKLLTLKGEKYSIEEVLKTLKEETRCVCFFGGDPGTQGDFALSFSEEVIKIKPDIRICWETNGHLSKSTLKKFFDLSLKTGGIFKIDLKAFDENINTALTGFSNKVVLSNIKCLGEALREEKTPFPFMVSTLLVPGYVESEEVSKISRFLAEINPEIPYSILCFYPNHFMKDLPFIKKDELLKCIEEIKKSGLKNFNIGNKNLVI